MSSLTAPRPAAADAVGTTVAPGPARDRGHRPASDLIVGGGVALALAVVAFAAQGGQDIGQATWADIGLTLGGAAVVALALVRAPRASRLWGGASLALLAALAVWTALSIGWSVLPDDSWQEASRTLSYVAVFAAGLALARLAPDRATALLAGVATACVLVVGWGLLVKIGPGSFAPTEIYPRVRAPFAYWNAVGVMAALGVPPLLWLGTRRAGHAAVNALACPALGLLLTGLLLAQSRGALLALLAGLVVWFSLTPLRLRGVALLAPALVAAGLAAGWTFGRPALSDVAVPLTARDAAGHRLGLLLLALLAVLTLAGLVVAFVAAHGPLDARRRRRAGLSVLAVLAALALGGLAALQTRPGGIAHQVSRAVHQLTDTTAAPPRGPSRLTAAASSRARYWKEAVDVAKPHPSRGTGAGGFATARARVSRDDTVVRHAHGYLAQTLADLGIVGVVLSLALLVTWLVAARRTARTGGAATALLAVTTVFGVHSLVDWTWFVPAVATVGLLTAGWLAGRGPGEPPGPRPARRDPVRLAAAAGTLAVALLVAWTALGPLRAQDTVDSALAAADRGDFARARAELASARSEDPLAREPLWTLGTVEDAAGRPRAARAALRAAVRLAPRSSEGWLRLGQHDLAAGRPRVAQRELAAALGLDPHSIPARTAFLSARVTAVGRR